MNIGKVKKIMDDMPNTILSIVVVLIILAAGVSAFFMVYGGVGYTQEQTEIFSVSNPSQDSTLTLNYYPTTIETVEQYNGYNWVVIPSAGYTLAQKTVTVSNTYL